MADARPLLDSYALYIDGRWVEPENGRYDDISPATEATIAQAPDAGLADVDAAISAARRAFDAGPWANVSVDERARCLNQLGNALMQHADEFFALSQAEWGCTANERMIQIDGPAFMALNTGRTRRPARRRADQPVRGRRNDAASSRAAGCRVDPDAVELPAQPQRDEGEPRVGRWQHDGAQAVTADAARRPRARANHRRTHRYSARGGQRRHAQRHRGEQAADHRPAHRHGRASPEAPRSDAR